MAGHHLLHHHQQQQQQLHPSMHQSMQQHQQHHHHQGQQNHHLSQQQQQQYQSGLHPYHHPQSHPYSPYSSGPSLMYHPGGGPGHVKDEHLGVTGNSSISKNQTSSDCGVPLPASKPKIWSLADTAACKTPPHHLHPLGLAGQELNSHLMHNHQHHEHHHHLAHAGPHQQMQDHQHPDGGHQANPWGQGVYGEPQYQTTPHHHHPQQQQAAHMNQHLSSGGSGMGSNLAAMQGLADSLSASGGAGPATLPNFQEGPHQLTSPGNGLMQQYDNMTYARGPTSGFLGGSRHSNSMDTDSSSYNPHMSALTGPPEATTNAANSHLLQHPSAEAGTTASLSLQHSHRSSSNGSSHSSSHTGTPPVGMGSFPELQTDTPPQTPPNMKLPSVAGTGTCYSNSSSVVPRKATMNGYGGGIMPSSPSSNGSAAMGFTGSVVGRRQDCSGNAMTGGDSDHDSFKTSSMSSSSSSSSGSASPFFKR